MTPPPFMVDFPSLRAKKNRAEPKPYPVRSEDYLPAALGRGRPGCIFSLTMSVFVGSETIRRPPQSEGKVLDFLQQKQAICQASVRFPMFSLPYSLLFLKFPLLIDKASNNSYP